MTPTDASSEFRHITRSVANGDVVLHSEALLNPNSSAPPVLLLSEAEAPSSRWPESLRHGLASRSGGVIWFDTRDCGRSSWCDEPYALEDLAVDALVVLDAYEVSSAHVLGRSMGGQIAQQLALAMPSRVATLTLLSSTPGRNDEFGLPEDWLIDKMSERLFADPPDDAPGRAAWIVEQQEWFSGPVFGFDREAALARAAAEVEMGWRGSNLHGEAVVNAPDIADFLQHITAPTIVIHGTADPVFPVPHAQALADRIPDAQLMLIEGLGHELPEGFAAQLVGIVASMLRT